MHYHSQRKNSLLPTKPTCLEIIELAFLLDYAPKVRVKARRKGGCLPAVVHRITQLLLPSHFSLQAAIEFEWMGQYKREALVSFTSRNSLCPSVWTQRRDPGCRI